MERRVKLSRKAQRKLEGLFDYLENKWSKKIKNDFIKKPDSVIEHIKVNPNYFPESNQKKGIHKCVVTKQTTVFYKFDDNGIYVITLFDNRQNPEKLKKELD